ncbi:cruciform-cutting endonuclease Cce1 [Schizosaccharomyces pombe]|uniref:Cruciform cutting endonuclease 1, mitochondrial n=1 Tax=Schizosaccharomyces pombe (strain 972 / ATCC 24843) TaxID=284812 RepID=CCE1_SCHPO|nr:cruciform cutting endonuclease Cce1 [Schizosaccharomyces pombe]Q10423.1 RecName: Full=Cruciform cutting endonuclease 1, mitochondrial; AltName: Full=Protein ydc2; Flags: Precursor [Schizosaccharomyces pombe 972h-]1KCF_A Chain A, Hypothetical 30.2 Kd Protein C25g10.02 In Chromosome I [Schizosaccharomyces pombe]1KCF_B Chain B, Hypothetical 30.2 Kd Protein C25g10.02 In Chromosome I [Schizosaccharomyces pombe]CAA94631.1 mitochondrial cruciform cutting endonuclease Cce1 [Schizosaccharomyces pombe|eukprot:NP_594522.1 cruciform cutting endonuclease Cce1 [Schizosaccharomyces pombe]
MATVKLSFLQHICKLTGLSRSGRKDELLRRIVDSPIYPTSRVLGIDLGIKNFSYCFASQNEDSKVIIHNWSVENLTEKNGLDIQWTEDFQPSSMADLSIQLFNTLHEKFNPHVILMERQRYRSGIATIPEWTLRVNMLESMLYALHYAEKRNSIEQKIQYPFLLSLSPKSTYSYWASVLNTKASFSKKKSRVQMVKELIDGQKILFENEEALYKWNNGSRVEFKKDDMADSALIASGWMRWQAQLKHYRNFCKQFLKQ